MEFFKLVFENPVFSIIALIVIFHGTAMCIQSFRKPNTVDEDDFNG